MKLQTDRLKAPRSLMIVDGKFSIQIFATLRLSDRPGQSRSFGLQKPNHEAISGRSELTGLLGLVRDFEGFSITNPAIHFFASPCNTRSHRGIHITADVEHALQSRPVFHLGTHRTKARPSLSPRREHVLSRELRRGEASCRETSVPRAKLEFRERTTQTGTSSAQVKTSDDGWVLHRPPSQLSSLIQALGWGLQRGIQARMERSGRHDVYKDTLLIKVLVVWGTGRAVRMLRGKRGVVIGSD